MGQKANSTGKNDRFNRSWIISPDDQAFRGFRRNRSHMLYALGAVISLIIAVVSFVWMRGQSDPNNLLLVVGIVFGILTIVFGGLFLAGRINKTEDIHVTE